MITRTGENAGRVYEHLRGKKLSFNQLVKGTNLNSREADRAIGWLAREGKILVVQERKEEFFTIVE